MGTGGEGTSQRLCRASNLVSGGRFWPVRGNDIRQKRLKAMVNLGAMQYSYPS